MAADPIEYRKPRAARHAARRAEYPGPLLLLLATFVFWTAHLLCEASIGYCYFAHRSGRTGRYFDDFLTSTFVDGVMSFGAAVVFFAVPFVIWCAGWMQLRSRLAGLAAICGAAFCVSRWVIWYYCTAKGYPYEQSPAEYMVAGFVAALLSTALLKAKGRE